MNRLNHLECTLKSSLAAVMAAAVTAALLPGPAGAECPSPALIPELEISMVG